MWPAGLLEIRWELRIGHQKRYNSSSELHINGCSKSLLLVVAVTVSVQTVGQSVLKLPKFGASGCNVSRARWLDLGLRLGLANARV